MKLGISCRKGPEEAIAHRQSEKVGKSLAPLKEKHKIHLNQNPPSSCFNAYILNVVFSVIMMPNE